MDTQYIKGMLKNSDVRPNVAVNGWIAAILFDFKLVHVLAEKHQGPDGLSRHEPVPAKTTTTTTWKNGSTTLMPSGSAFGSTTGSTHNSRNTA